MGFLSFVPIVLVSCGRIPGAVSAFQIGRLYGKLSIDLWLVFLGWLAG